MKFDIIAVETPYRGYFRIDRYRLKHELFAGGWGPEISREVFERGRSVAMLPYDPVLDSVVMIEQFRLPAHLAGYPAWHMEIIAGVMDTKETPEQVARREAREEADLAVSDLIRVCDYLVSPGGATECTALFIGRADLSKAGGIHGLPEEGEDIRVHVLSLDEIRVRLAANTINNAAALLALQHLLLHRDRIRAEWGRA
jgi:ADP-ribose pyrophosphatase